MFSPDNANQTDGMAQATIAKLTDVANDLRRARDDSHRQKLTAFERLRLTRQEVDAMEATTADLEKQLHELEAKKQQAKQVAVLQQEVQSLTREVRERVNNTRLRGNLSWIRNVSSCGMPSWHAGSNLVGLRARCWFRFKLASNTLSSTQTHLSIHSFAITG